MLRVTCLLLLVVIGTTTTAAEVSLDRRTSQVLHKKIVPALIHGKDVELVGALSRLVSRLSQSKLDEIDRQLARLDAPKSTTLLAERRIELALQNAKVRLPKPGKKERKRTIALIFKQINESIKVAQNHPALGEDLPNPQSLAEYRRLFWDLHVLKNRFTNARQLQKLGRGLIRGSRDHSVNKRDRLRELTERTQQMDTIADVMVIRGMMLRTKRIQFASSVVAKTSNRFIDRLEAAFTVDVDGHALSQRLRDRALAKKVPDEIWKSSRDSVESSVKFVRSFHKPMVMKSRQLFVGLHWWLRGRYGQGTEKNGLLKTELALKNPRAMFGLYMPKDTPKPTNPAESQQLIPAVQRRHHLLWQFGHIEARHFVSIRKTIDTSEKTETKLSRFY